MKIKDHITIFAGSPQAGESAGGMDKAEADKGGRKNMTIFAGNLQGDFALKDRIQRKQEQARKQALKVVSEAWNGDRQIEEELDKSRRHIKELQQANREAQDNLGDIAMEREALQSAYGITEESEEEAELELLRRGEEALRTSHLEDLTKEEWAQYEEIQERGITDYQSRQLELDGRERMGRETLDKNHREIEYENAVIRGIRHERLKSSPMLDAQKEADSLLEAAREEIIGMVVEDAKEHIDEKQEEREEQAESIKEKKEEQEELLEKRKEKEEEQEDILGEMSVDQMADINKTQAEIRQEVQKIVDEMNLVAEDIKGSMVDANV